ncbi:hypothetical protein PWY87_10105 [Kribbella solani]|uniref:hypothetical protein n=1 Tax=Kribbella solani TaxID=236067 RepID=UPI0029B466E7|nr:hypothetical protein [Kribbella solani]MDX3002022.1 hypothetical protein [Kribbella solani]
MNHNSPPNPDDEFARALAFTPPTDPYVICWRDLDPESTTEELETLAAWITWATTRYSLDHKVIPPCWSHHGAIIEELSALRTFWEACYQADAAPSDPLAFHRDLTLALRRLRDWSSLLGCTRTSHRPEAAG